MKLNKISRRGFLTTASAGSALAFVHKRAQQDTILQKGLITALLMDAG